MIIRPIGERVLLKHQEEEKMTKGGIYIPESAQKEKGRNSYSPRDL